MKTFVILALGVLVATLAVAQEKSPWQWQQDDKPLADLGDTTINEIIVCPNATLIVACTGKDGGKILAVGSSGDPVPFEIPPQSSGNRFKDLILSPDGKSLSAIDTYAWSFRVFSWTVADRKLLPSQSSQVDVARMATAAISESLSDVSLEDKVLVLAFAKRSHSKTYAPVYPYVPFVQVVKGAQTADVELGGHIRDLVFAPASKPEDRYLAVAVWDYKGKAPGHYGPYWLCILGLKAELLKRHKLLGAPYEVAVSPKDLSKIAVATFSGLVIMDARTGKTVSLGPQHTTGAVHFLPDGVLIATSEEGVRLWDISKKAVLATLGKKGPIANAIASNAYGTELYAAYGGRIYRFKRQRPESEPVAATGGK